MSKRLEEISKLLLEEIESNILNGVYIIYTIGINSEPFILNEEDYIWASNYTWYSNSSGYVYRNELNKKILLHREIYQRLNENISFLEIDHKNRNPLDNRRCNLRKATRQQNICNSIRHNGNSRSSSKYRGVNYIDSRWQASIKFNGKNIYIGRFKTEIEAAKAYNEKAKEIHGEFAFLNEINLNNTIN